MHWDSSAAGYTMVQEDDLAREGGWRLVRRTLGLRAFGMNLVEVAPGADLPAHDERHPDQEEVYVVLAGRPTIRIGDDELGARPGTFVRIASEPVRSVVNRGDEPDRLLMVSAPTASGFEPQDSA